jgi:L-fuculose-phosphate aldolase
VSFGESVEKAYWWTEILDAYCRILMLARDLGKVTYFDEPKARELLDLKTQWGYTDPRLSPGMENCDICANDIFRESWQQTGVQRRAFDAPPPMGARARTEGRTATAVPTALGVPSSPLPSAAVPDGASQEALIQAITDRVMAALAER